MTRYYPSTPRDNDPHYVYTFWKGSTALYVGCTVNLASRIRDHQRYGWMSDATWVAWVEFPTRSEALDAETERIRKLMPRRNVRHNPGCERLHLHYENYLAQERWRADFEEWERRVAKWQGSAA